MGASSTECRKNTHASSDLSDIKSQYYADEQYPFLNKFDCTCREQYAGVGASTAQYHRSTRESLPTSAESDTPNNTNVAKLPTSAPRTNAIPTSVAYSHTQRPEIFCPAHTWSSAITKLRIYTAAATVTDNTNYTSNASNVYATFAINISNATSATDTIGTTNAACATSAVSATRATHAVTTPHARTAAGAATAATGPLPAETTNISGEPCDRVPSEPICAGRVRRTSELRSLGYFTRNRRQ